jgi:hypothetical protein
MQRIQQSVGRGGHNRREDVAIVQQLLNARSEAGSRPLVVDGVYGPATQAAIDAYQRRVLPHGPQDGRIDPLGPTFRSLTGGFQAAPAVQRPAAAGQGNQSGVGQAMAFFIARGWTVNQAAGIVANLVAESGLRSNAVGDGGNAYGIAQWHPDRQANFQNWAGKPIRESTFEQQLEFVHHELRFGHERTAGNLLLGTTDAYRAGDVVSRRYERPLLREVEAARRGNAAAALAQSYAAR